MGIKACPRSIGFRYSLVLPRQRLLLQTRSRAQVNSNERGHALTALGFAALLGLVAVMAYIRLAPSDPKIWHVAISNDAPARPGPCADQVQPLRNGARALCLVQGKPSEVLAKLAAIAEAYPRTSRLAGSAAEGRMTWFARSRIMGFPDFITAEVSAVPDGTRLEVFARQRFGEGDMGVNAARLRVWLSQI